MYDSYGKKCNSRFLLNYGFIVENNDGNEFPFHLQLEKSDPQFLFKKNILYGELNKTFLIQEVMNDAKVLDFFSFLRFKVLDGKEEELIKVFFF